MFIIMPTWTRPPLPALPGAVLSPDSASLYDKRSAAAGPRGQQARDSGLWPLPPSAVDDRRPEMSRIARVVTTLSIGVCACLAPSCATNPVTGRSSWP